MNGLERREREGDREPRSKKSEIRQTIITILYGCSIRLSLVVPLPGLRSRETLGLTFIFLFSIRLASLLLFGQVGGFIVFVFILLCVCIFFRSCEIYERDSNRFALIRRVGEGFALFLCLGRSLLSVISNILESHHYIQ